MKNSLYEKFAPFYAAMSNDRNFEGQLSYLLSSYKENQPCDSLLELFAGQSAHSIAAQKMNGIDVWAIDYSEDMKVIALNNGFKSPEQYIVGSLPQAVQGLKSAPPFDCVLCLYHGLSNLGIDEVYQLLKNVKQILSPTGKFFIEIHNISKIMEYIATPRVTKDSLHILQDEVIEYSWPADKIRWDPFSFSAEVPVKIYPADPAAETIDLISRDSIYSAEEIIFLSGLLGYQRSILTNGSPRDSCFGFSVLLQLMLPT